MAVEQSLRCFIIGADSLLMECGEILRQRGHSILGVITRAPRVVQWAGERNLRCIDAESDYRQALHSYEFEYLFSITHLSLIPNDVVALPRCGAINFHDGPLPRYAGMNAPVWALLNGDSTYGITWHLMTAAVDSGDILKQKLFPISPDETALSLNTKCFEAGIESFGELVDELASGAMHPEPQDVSQRSYFGKHRRPPAACVLDWSRPAVELARLVGALDFGRYRNPVGSPKLQYNGHVIIATRAVAGHESVGAEPGTIVSAPGKELVVATGEGTISLLGLTGLDGREVKVEEVIAKLHLQTGGRFDALAVEQADRLTAVNTKLCLSESFWVGRLSALEPLELPWTSTTQSSPAVPRYQEATITISDSFRSRFPADELPKAVLAAFGTYLVRIGGKDRFHIEFADTGLRQWIEGLEPWAATHVPLEISLQPTATFVTAVSTVGEELERVRGQGTFLRDVAARYPELHGRTDVAEGPLLPVAVELRDEHDHAVLPSGSVVTLAIFEHDGSCRLIYDAERLPLSAMTAMRRQFAALLESIASRTEAPIAELDLLPAEERQRVLFDWNRTDRDYRRDAGIHRLFEEQVEQTPEATALVFEDESLSYRELNRRANQLAAHLRALGVGPDQLVGIHLERSPALLIATLAVWKAGGAYVPLDPAFPRDRIAFMIEDAKLAVLITRSEMAGGLPKNDARPVLIDAPFDPNAAPSVENLPGGAQSSNLAYVLYTSGSTGKPKGVMVEHRNVVNFFTGMNERIAHDPPGCWLAVTTLSFDISVLELFWTLSHGFKVVLHRDRDREGTAAPTGGSATASARRMDFALYYWGNDAGPGRRKYELLLEGAKFADRNGFSAVWTPERHFHAFGGPYPNPSVTGAAIAAATSRIQVRAGSCVLPLHHPIRVVEEWAVVDNLSDGRVGISFASGWQPHDFVLRPENYKDNKAKMFRDIEIVRRLWRGESVPFPGPSGELIERTALPRPVQPELPVWITTAGNPETYRQAGAIGANVLTHLLGQSVEDVGEKIRMYRESLQQHGYDPASRTVTLMLHTFVGEDDDTVRDLVRGPMKDYLRSSVDLIKSFAWAFPAFKRPTGGNGKPPEVDLQSLSPEELDAILEHAFLRYFETSGLFGSVETCLAMVDRLKSIGVDEIGCLIDFGLPTKAVLESLPALNRVRERANVGAIGRDGDAGDYSAAGQIRRHGVTHLQCTPSMGRMLLMDDESRRALGSVRHLMIGGEAFPPALARDLRGVITGTITNMYGPTETTIWSSTYRLDGDLPSIPIGRPIANTQFYVVDRNQQPVPVGIAGELYIGGEGIARGYLNRPELTAERFVHDPFRGGAARMYRTGDLARFRADGMVDFLGRNDHQVKIRGYRIELGEIEALLSARADVRECVVVVREDTPGDQRLVAYVAPGERSPESRDWKEYLREKLPDYMVPAAIVTLRALPLTPNGKVDRKALPAPDTAPTRPEGEYVAPGNELEDQIARLWQETLALESVGVEDNFFDIGGHSLLVVKMHRKLRTLVEKPITLTDLYRFPTVRSLSRFLGSDTDGVMLQQSADRAQRRRELLQRRRQTGRSVG